MCSPSSRCCSGVRSPSFKFTSTVTIYGVKRSAIEATHSPCDRDWWSRTGSQSWHSTSRRLTAARNTVARVAAFTDNRNHKAGPQLHKYRRPGAQDVVRTLHCSTESIVDNTAAVRLGRSRLFLSTINPCVGRAFYGCNVCYPSNEPLTT